MYAIPSNLRSEVEKTICYNMIFMCTDITEGEKRFAESFTLFIGLGFEFDSIQYFH